jgi:cobyrinic acid a,c-diamide synthase
VVVDTAHASLTHAAIVAGLATFDPDVTVAGTILNRVASPRHGAEVARGLARLGIPVPWSRSLAIPPLAPDRGGATAQRSTRYAESDRAPGCPVGQVVVVVDTAHASLTHAAVVAGLATFDPDVTVAGTILNRRGDLGAGATTSPKLAVEQPHNPLNNRNIGRIRGDETVG